MPVFNIAYEYRLSPILTINLWNLIGFYWPKWIQIKIIENIVCCLKWRSKKSDGVYYKQNETDRQPASQLKSYKFTSNASKCKNIRQLIKIETFYLCVFNVLIFDFWRDVCLIVSERTTKTETQSIFSKLSALRYARYLFVLYAGVSVGMNENPRHTQIHDSKSTKLTHRQRKRDSPSTHQLRWNKNEIHLSVKIFFLLRFYWAIKRYSVYKYTHLICSDDGDDRIKRPNTSRNKIQWAKNNRQSIKIRLYSCQWIILMGP